MGQRTSIEWTEVTWNPTTGCTRVSAGCDNCYAEALSRRLLSRIYTRRMPVVNTAAKRRDPFAVRIWPERLAQPASWRKPRLVFVNSMSDLFHRDIPPDFLRESFKVMLEVNRHTYQVLTKRPARAARFVRENVDLFGNDGLPPHIWIGTSTENQETAYRIRHLQQVPAVVRFLSCEPLIGPLSLCKVWTAGDIHWVIVGGESGAGRRPMEGAGCRRSGTSVWLRRYPSSLSSGEGGHRRRGGVSWRDGSGMRFRGPGVATRRAVVGELCRRGFGSGRPRWGRHSGVRRRTGPRKSWIFLRSTWMRTRRPSRTSPSDWSTWTRSPGRDEISLDSGNGSHTDERDSRAFIVGSAARAIRVDDRPFDRLVFVEKDRQRFRQLKRNV